jgi:opacity protein-like surface antigen
MLRLRMLVITVFATMVFTSIALAQETPKHEISVQGTGFFTNDTTGRGIRQHTTNSGGLLISYRYHLNKWVATDGSYGYTRNTFQNSAFFNPDVFDVQTMVNQFTGAFVLTPWSAGAIKPFAIAGAGILNFDPVTNHLQAGDFNIRLSGQYKGAFVYGAGTDINISDRFAFRLEYRGLVYGRPDFGQDSLNSRRTTHSAQPSAGIVFKF